MNVVRHTEITLTPTEVIEIIKNHFKEQNVDIDTVYFNIQGHNQDDDWRSEYPLVYRLDSVICKSIR